MPPVQLLFGPMLIGTYMNAILYGVMVVQVFIYYQTYKRDAFWMRCFVTFLFICETLNTGFDVGMMYEPLVVKYGTPSATTFFPLMLAADPLMTVIISTPIQIFIAWRIRIISRATWLALAICVLATISLGGGLWLTVTVIQIRRYARKPELHWPALTWLLASAIADVSITVSLAFNLSKRKTGFGGTDDAINRIIRLTIQTGFVTAVFAILDVVCFLTLPHTTINFVWDFALSKLYTNALMSTVNARGGWGTLTDRAHAPNVLFGDESRSPQTYSYSTSNFRATQNVATGPYELGTASAHRGIKNIQHEEYGGVAITKEITTLHDPPYISTQ